MHEARSSRKHYAACFRGWFLDCPLMAEMQHPQLTVARILNLHRKRIYLPPEQTMLDIV